jgi:hypothetical protein
VQWIDVTRVELVKVGPHQRESKQKASENHQKKTKQSDASFNRQTNDSTLHASSSTVNTAAKMVYIRQSQLPKLKEYKYSGMFGTTLDETFSHATTYIVLTIPP